MLSIGSTEKHTQNTSFFAAGPHHGFARKNGLTNNPGEVLTERESEREKERASNLAAVSASVVGAPLCFALRLFPQVPDPLDTSRANVSSGFEID